MLLIISEGLPQCQMLIEKLITQRNDARSNKDFELADKIRSELNDMNIEIEDTPDGTVWKSKS